MTYTNVYIFREKGANSFSKNVWEQGDLYLTGHDTDQRQCAMEWPTTVWEYCFTNIY
jgi:hypothetical protein